MDRSGWRRDLASRGSAGPIRGVTYGRSTGPLSAQEILRRRLCIVATRGLRSWHEYSCHFYPAPGLHIATSRGDLTIRLGKAPDARSRLGLCTAFTEGSTT